MTGRIKMRNTWRCMSNTRRRKLLSPIFWFNLPDAQQKIVDQYMFAAVSLYHRLLDMTFTQQEKRTGSD